MTKTQLPILKSALIGGGLTTVIVFMGTYMLGRVSDLEAINNIQEVRPTLRFTASGTMTATATILALMLTLLSFSNQAERNLKGYHYDRIHWIARFSAGVFIAALVLLMLLNVPIGNAEESFGGFYNVVYYVLLVYAAVIGGFMITIVLLLYQATRDIIALMHPDSSADYLYQQDEREEGMVKRERERMREDKGE